MAGVSDELALSSYLDFLSDELLMPGREQLDPATLAGAVAAAEQQKQTGSQPAKRLKREASSAPDLGDNEDYSDDEEEEPRSKGSKRRGNAAAQNKANREKARREKINDRFVSMFMPIRQS
jgi:hypothetical protein